MTRLTRDELIEQMARAICLSLGLDWGLQADPLTSGSGSDEEQDGYREMAAAALSVVEKHGLPG